MKLRTLLGLGALIAVAWIVWDMTRDVPLDRDLSDDEFFKYGSIGSEPGGTFLRPVGGLLPPAPIFKVLTTVCGDVPTRTGPSAYARVSSYEDFGLIYETGTGDRPRDLPVGISRRRRLGMEMLGVNCALCHAGTVREAPGAKALVVPGMPPQQVDLQRLFRFIFDCVQSSGFTVARVIDQIEIAEERRVGLPERVRYALLVPRIRGQVRELDAKIGVLTGDRIEASGPGRLDTINPGKALELGWDLAALLESDRRAELIGTADFPSAWKLGDRRKPGFRMHWDGNFGTVEEVLGSALLAVGAKPQTVDDKAFTRIAGYLARLEPRRYPYQRNPDLVTSGGGVFTVHCARCHDLDAPGAGQVTPNDQLRADPHRLDAFSAEYASRLPVALTRNYARSDFTFQSVQKTGGYANVPLDGIWARAPYLHNGSVPTLRDLLQPEHCRPPRFYRGSDVYDQANVGFVSYVEEPTDAACRQRPDAPRPRPGFAEAPGGGRLFLFDTSRPGNRNTGHPWGTDLAPDEKTQLVEFLKTR